MYDFIELEQQVKSKGQSVELIKACDVQHASYTAPQHKDFLLGSKKSKINFFLHIDWKRQTVK